MTRHVSTASQQVDTSKQYVEIFLFVHAYFKISEMKKFVVIHPILLQKKDFPIRIELTTTICMICVTYTHMYTYIYVYLCMHIYIHISLSLPTYLPG